MGHDGFFDFAVHPPRHFDQVPFGVHLQADHIRRPTYFRLIFCVGSRARAHRHFVVDHRLAQPVRAIGHDFDGSSCLLHAVIAVVGHLQQVFIRRPRGIADILNKSGHENQSGDE